jgi:hypothetical protein
MLDGHNTLVVSLFLLLSERVLALLVV